MALSISQIENNSILICPQEEKNRILMELNQHPLKNIKFLSKKDILDGVYFTYDDASIIYLMNQYHLSFDNAIEILTNLYSIQPGTKKLDSLYAIYQDLEKNHLLKHDYFFPYLFRNKKVYVLGYSEEDQELQIALKKLQIDFKQEKLEKGNFLPSIDEYENMEEEVDAFFHSICELKEKGISLNQILLYSYPENYDLLLRKYSYLYHLPIEFDHQMTLNDSPVFHYFLEDYEQTKSLETSFQNTQKMINFPDYHAIKKLNLLLNSLLNYEKEITPFQEYLIAKAKKISLANPTYEEAIRIIDSTYRGDGYVFMLSFSLGNYPSISKDTDLLLDKEKEICLRNTSTIQNRIKMEEIENFMTSIEHLFVSRRTKEGKESFYPSLISERLHLLTKKGTINNRRYNKPLMDLEVANKIDLNHDYGTEDPYLHALKKEEIHYLEYHHDFIYSPLFANTEKLKLSYTQINEYNHCPFLYFIKRLCAGTAFEDTFYTKLGSLFHDILNDSLTKEIDLKDYQERINQDFTTPKDQFFIQKVLPQVKLVIEKNQEFMKYSDFNQPYGEQDITIPMDEKATFNGRIDKVLVSHQNGKKQAIIIDYKTGSLSFKKKLVPLGLDLQLPLYGYLLKKKYPDYEVKGVYIQKINETDLNKDNLFMLEGITLDEDGLLHQLDHGIGDKSKYIAKVGLGGRKATTSYVSQDELDSIIHIAEENIKNAIKNIRSGNFPIAPLMVDDQAECCKDCILKDVCFHDEKDYRRVSSEKKEEKEE